MIFHCKVIPVNCVTYLMLAITNEWMAGRRKGRFHQHDSGSPRTPAVSLNEAILGDCLREQRCGVVMQVTDKKQTQGRRGKKKWCSQ